MAGLIDKISPVEFDFKSWQGAADARFRPC